MNRFLADVCIVLIVLIGTGVHTSAQISSSSVERLLLRLPAPALEASEAIMRCPQGADTLVLFSMERIIAETQIDTSDIASIDDKDNHLRDKYLSTPRKQFERSIQTIGEQIDKEIQTCSKVLNDKGKHVYDPRCIEDAEIKGHHRRRNAVNEYLSDIRSVWPLYLKDARTLIGAGDQEKWHTIIHVATDVASITALAAQFAR